VAAAESLAADKMKEVEESRARLEKLRGQVEHSRSGRIKLNVGGSIFETTIATLTKFPDTFFYAAFVIFNSGDPAPLDADGCCFIDRDGKHFGTILEFLRKGNARLPMDADDIDDLMEEVRYYVLGEPFHAALEVGGAIKGGEDTCAGRGRMEGVRIEFTREEVLQMVATRHLHFAGCNLSGMNLLCVDLCGANLTHVDLSDAKLDRAQLTNANLTCAKLSRVSLRYANLNGADLTGANLSRATLEDASVRQARLINADLTNAKLSYTRKEHGSHSLMSGAFLNGAIMTHASR
jgi:hypothetical protein